MATGIIANRVEFSGPLTDADLAQLAGWQQIADGAVQSVTLWSKPDRYGRLSSEPARLGSEIIARLIGMSTDTQEWQVADLADLKAKVYATETEISFLRHHTWEELYARTDLTVTAEPGEVVARLDEEAPEEEGVNFKGLVLAHAPTPLAGDLVAHGYLPRHFARYASTFYGAVVGLNAAEYISRAIEPGVPLLEYELDEQAVGQILIEQHAAKDDADLFDDLSVYNLDIVGYLLNHRRGAAQRVATHLAERWEGLEQKFVGRFFQREDPELSGTLAALMARTWKQALRHTAVDAQLAPETRLHLVNAVLGAISAEKRDDLDADVGRYLSEHYAELPILTNSPNEHRATIVMEIMAAANGTIHDLTKLEPIAMAAVAQVSVYPVTATNLRALGGANRVALDVLRPQPTTRPIYDHFLDNLGQYLDSLKQLDPPGSPIKDPAKFASVLDDIAALRRMDLLDRFVEETSTGCRIPEIGDTAPEAWPALIRHRRTDPSIGNIQLYISEHGLDKALGGFLAECSEIITPVTTPNPERLAVAVEVLAAREMLPAPGLRVTLATSIAPGAIPIGQIAPEDANLVGPLLAANLLADEPETFNPKLLASWEDFESAVAASQRFGEFSDATTLPTRHLAKTLGSNVIHGATSAALIVKLSSLLPGATMMDASAIAHALAERSEHLDLPRIEALRAAGASDPSLVRLIAIQGEGLSLTDLRAILLAMHGDYARVSSGGSGTVRFENDQNHHVILERLIGVTHTGARHKHTKMYGTKLEANLEQPSP